MAGGSHIPGCDAKYTCWVTRLYIMYNYYTDDWWQHVIDSSTGQKQVSLLFYICEIRQRPTVIICNYLDY